MFSNKSKRGICVTDVSQGCDSWWGRLIRVVATKTVPQKLSRDAWISLPRDSTQSVGCFDDFHSNHCHEICRRFGFSI